MKNLPKKTRRGADLSDRTAHAADHAGYGRRSFLRTLGLGGAASLASTNLNATALFDFPLAEMLSAGSSDRKLVLVRLKGGNDGLNTIVPLYALNDYRQARPTIAHPDGNLIGLNTDFAVPEAMDGVMPLWSSGQMRIVNSVGYPDSSLSHFTGSDIIASGNSDLAENGDGWLARYYVNQNPDYRTEPTAYPPAVKIGGPTSILFNDSDKVDISANFANAERLENLVSTGQLFDNVTAPDDCYYGDQVLFLRTIFNSAELYSTAIAAAYQESETEAEYSGSLGEQLQLVARLIKGGLETPFYLVTLDGFDTHVSQPGTHDDLLADLSNAVAAFYEDLAAGNCADDVLTMTYSEFGRRIDQNGFGGTDHGAAAPVMLFGPKLDGSGTHGDNPDLVNVDPTGNLRHGTDFRSIYATLLENWLCLDGATVNEILGDDYARLPELGFTCGTTSVAGPVSGVSDLRHRVVPLSGGGYELELTLARATRLEADIVALNGIVLRRLGGMRYPAGVHQIPFTLPQLRGKPAMMAYGIRANGRRYGGKFLATGFR